ncbi:MAG: TonB-dependent receptor [Candidatus Cloacimonadaceae bacterium]|nr:TonB-dependent receptor [Candidatus Cloacimonadaceae bacterium]MDP3114358.1 TonB-dependent receptor [Candidatus Cloacimonadaceae bacterium]
MKKTTMIVLLLLSSLGMLFSATVSGFVTRAGSGEPLQYVNVRIAGTRIGAQTNKKGYYVLKLHQAGAYNLEISLISYIDTSISFTIKTPDENMSIDAALEKGSIELSKTVVTATGDPSLESPLIRNSLIRQSTEDIQMVVSPVEADVFRAVLTLPGVAPISDFSSGLYVRGGSPDQNLILLDDIDVYNPNHFGGIFSTFNSDAVESVDLIKGGYPAKYGGRMSSVLDVTNRQGNRVRHQGVARLSLISSSATLEGPWSVGAQSGSYMASIRRTYVEILKQFYDELPDYYFYDGQVKLNWDLDARNKLSFSSYFGRDDLSFDFGSVLALDWGNKTFTTQWVHLFSPTLFSQFIFAGSEYKSNFAQISQEGEEIFERVNGIHDLTSKAILSWKPTNNHQVDWGYELKWNNTWLKMDTTYQYEESAIPDVEVSSLTSAIYVQDVWDISELWTLQPGIRAAWYHTLKRKPGNIPKASYVNLEPRISLRRNLDVGESIYANYGIFNQYLTLMTIQISTPFDVWFPLDGSLEPGRSDHYTLGYKRDISRYFGFDIEAYYKTYKNLLQYNVGTDFTWNNETGTLSDTFHVGKGYTFGADLMLRNDWKGLQGFTGYTISRTRRKMKDVNIDPLSGESRYFYPKYDRSHSLTMVQTFNFSQNTGMQFLGADFKIGLNFTFNSGQPNDKPERIYFDGENFQLIYSYSDRIRLPYYMRLDLSTKYEWVKSWGSIEPYFEVINIFNRANVSFRNYNIVSDSEGIPELTHRDSTQFPFLPFIGLNVKW